MNSFKYNLIVTRKRNKMTQRQIADMLGVTEGCYAHWEQGRNEPNINYIIRLCQIFNISSDALLGMAELNVDSVPAVDPATIPPKRAD